MNRTDAKISKIWHWPPTQSVKTLLLYGSSEIYYNMNKAIEAEQKRSNVRKAAHCLIFAKFASSQSNKKALIMVRFFYICIQMAGIYAI